jgi:enoyl-CoA hydratase/carnithine racemase
VALRTIEMKSAPRDRASPPPFLRRRDAAGVAILTLDNPASRNALSLAMIEALTGAFAEIANAPSVRAVVIGGEGLAFSSGHDLRELAAHRSDRDGGKAFYERLFAACGRMMQAIVHLPKPVIAAVEGVATAAGCELVAACDLAIAGQTARFAMPGVGIGLFCSTPLVAVARAISRKHALEMAMTGALYGADQAERFGLIYRIVPAGRAVAEAHKLAEGLAARSPKTLAIGKKTFYEQVELNLSGAYARAAQAMVENLALPDADEGVGAFLEKRPPRWESE